MQFVHLLARDIGGRKLLPLAHSAKTGVLAISILADARAPLTQEITSMKQGELLGAVAVAAEAASPA